MSDDVPRPPCFATLDRVLPFEAETGLRGPNRDCLPCPALRECLKAAAVTPQGRQVREERVEDTCGHGLLARMRMWHEKKLLKRK